MVKELPRELWLEIFKHFIVNFGVAELYKYRKVCKVWCGLIIIIIIDKLMNTISRIQYYYQIVRGSSSNNTEEESQQIKEEPRNFITYNYDTESFEYNFITILKNEDEKKEYYKFCILFHLFYKILNFNLFKILRESLMENNWINIEEDVDEFKFSQKIIVKGDRLLPCIDQIHDLIDYLNNLSQ